MEASFHGKVALVTGAGKGIGRAVAVQLASAGATVIAISRTQADLDTLKTEVPGIACHCVDVGNWPGTRAVVESLGPVDLLVNNAGVTNVTSFVDVTKDELDDVFDINFNAIFNISQVVVRGMVERGSGGSIVNMSSIQSLRASRDHTIYCSTKGAIDSLTQAMAVELGPYKIRVNSINPTLILTRSGKMAASLFGSVEALEARTPLRKLPEVDDVVNATLFLLSDKAAMMSGVCLPLDGGLIGTTQHIATSS